MAWTQIFFSIGVCLFHHLSEVVKEKNGRPNQSVMQMIFVILKRSSRNHDTRTPKKGVDGVKDERHA